MNFGGKPGDLAIAQEHLRNANEAYRQAVSALKDSQKTRGSCAEAFEKVKKKSGDTNYARKGLDEAVLAEKATEDYMRNALQELRARQSAYDKLVHLVASERKAQKEAQARAKRKREQSDEGKKKKSEKQNQQQESKDEMNKNNKQKTRQRQEPKGERKFWKDDYQEPPPKAEQAKDKQWQGFRKPQRARKSGTSMPPSAWKIACDKALSDRSTMTSFPDPPYSSCAKRGCGITRNQRTLRACQCNIAAALQQDPEYPASLKAERLRWHPDKFSVCPEEHRLVFQAKAKEIFVVANHLYERDGKLD
jgi:hypothetical protein